MNLGITDVRRKLKSIPESEPLYTIIKSRTKATGIIIGSSWNAIRKTELESPPIASAML